ncbi:MAG TPA: DUF2780 domain-containing protein [Thermodesulfobacteriota bacterium]|nr:DUF2780 domain-containing protein [Thermodesulfobacteriota bacterium]
MDLIELLVKNLGVNEKQASGGAGLIFKLAQERLGAGEFSQIAQHVPNLDRMFKDAPESGGILGDIGGITSAIGGKTGELGKLAALAGGFSKLGLDKDMIGKFVPIILSFLQDRGGEGAKDNLKKALQ